MDPSGLDWDWQRYGQDVGQVFLGYGDALWGVAKSPVSAAQFLGAWAGNGYSSDFVKQGGMAAWNEFASGLAGDRGARGFGQSFGDLLILAGTIGAGAAEGGAFSKMAYVTRWDTPAGISDIAANGIAAGKFVQRGRGNYFQYLLTGTQEMYRFENKITTKIPKKFMKFPRGVVEIKYGQHITEVTFRF